MECIDLILLEASHQIAFVALGFESRPPTDQRRAPALIRERFQSDRLECILRTPERSFAPVFDRVRALLQLLLAGSGQFGGRNTQTVPVAEEENLGVLSLSAGVWLDPLAPARAGPNSTQEAERSIAGVGSVVLSHDWLDRLSRIVCVVERNGGDVVVQDVGLDDAVEKLTTDEAKFAIDSRCGASSEGPSVTGVVRERWVGMLEESDGN